MNCYYIRFKNGQNAVYFNIHNFYYENNKLCLFSRGNSYVYQIEDITCFQIVSENYANNLTYTVNKVFD